MDKNLIKVNLLPGYKEDTFISKGIYRIVFAIFFIFVLYFFMFLPYRTAQQNLEIAKYEKSKLVYSQAYYSAQLADRIAVPKDVVYDTTIEIVQDAQFPLNSWINQLSAVDVQGARIESFEIFTDLETLQLTVSYSSDQALLEFEQKLWDIYWIDSISYSEAGPGSQDFDITFKVGDSIED